MERIVRDHELLDDVPSATRSEEPRENGHRGTLPPPLPPPPRFSYAARDGRSSNRPGELVHVGPAYASPPLVTLPPPVLVDRSSLLGLAAIVVFGQVIGTAAAFYLANHGGSPRALETESRQHVSVDSLTAVPELAARSRERAAEPPLEAAPASTAAAPAVQPVQPLQAAQPAKAPPGTEAVKSANRAARRAPRPLPTPSEPTESAPAPAVARAGLFDTVY